MKLATFQQPVEVASIEQLRKELQFRHDCSFGSFWLWHPTGTELALMVNGSDAYIHFLPGGDHPGYQAAVRDRSDEILFLADNYEPTPMPRFTTIPLATALIAVEEFFRSGQRPSSISWDSLCVEPTE